jgi:hypothetical protein
VVDQTSGTLERAMTFANAARARGERLRLDAIAAAFRSARLRRHYSDDDSGQLTWSM